MGNIKCIELTKDNYNGYLDEIEKLEKLVLDKMEKEGRIGQFFTTGKEGIEEYILSDENTVMVEVDEKNQIQSACYITQGQAPFTYNDITKYFKYGQKYKEYIRSQYKTDIEYKQDILKIYEIKLKAFEYAKKKILEECPNYNGNIIDYLQAELKEKDNEFHEKSALREGFNKYMAEYIDEVSKNDKSVKKLYNNFYWITSDDISKEFKRDVEYKSGTVQEYEALMNSQENQEYTQILNKGPLKILEEPNFDDEKYYSANTNNSIEIDTYITNPESRHAGLARVIVYEGIKKHILKHFEQTQNDEIFLCSTLHRDNISSKYVSEFFGLRDSLYVQRRSGRNREVHICKILREEYQEYLEDMEDKLITLYEYNPKNKPLSDDRKYSIIKEQIAYENKQIESLKKVESSGKYKGSFEGLTSKVEKVKMLQEQARKILVRINRRMENNCQSRY